MEKININPEKLYKGCVFAAIVHAVTVGEYPELNYEHSWDGFNYCMNDSQGCKATITFHPDYIIAVFQDMSKYNFNTDMRTDIQELLTEMPEDILELARSEALRYVLEDINGEIQPVITAAFWGTWDELSSSQAWDEIWENGGHIIRNQLLSHQESMVQWDDHYGLNNEQVNLIESLYERKMQNGSDAIYMSEEEMKYLYGDIGECIDSLQELNIYPYSGYKKDFK